MINEINSLTVEELKTIINYKSHLFSNEELKAAKERLNELCINNNVSSSSFNDSATLTNQLRRYNISEGELNNLTDTHILLGIFKRVNTIKNILITGMILGIAGIMLNLFVNK